MNLENVVKRVNQALRDGGVYAEVYAHYELPVVQVEISWGDWKHDHLRSEWNIREKFGVEPIAAQVTEEDGSDCYSAVYSYVFSEEVA